MSIAVVMPQLGLTMEEGTVSAWLKKTGDTVKKNDLLFSVSTDKVEMDVESVADGVLGEIVERAGSTVRVGTVLAYIVGSQDDSVAPVGAEAARNIGESPTASEERATVQPVMTPAGNGNSSDKTVGPRQLVSPRAKRLAKELGIDASRVRGKSAGGQITEEDIRAAAATTKTPRSDGNRRQLITERLTRSIHTIPTFSVAAEMNVENLVALYESLKATPSEAPTVKLTITDLLLSAFAQALKSSDELNAAWEENEVRYRTSVDIALAVATEKGVVGPVIRNVNNLDLQALAARRSELVEKARAGRLSLTDLEGGIATLSNLGMYRVDHFQAIINPGQSSILAVGQIRQRPWVEKVLTAKPTLILNLTVDHRVADGAAAAVLLDKIIQLIEEPGALRSKSTSSPETGDRRPNG